MKTAVERRFLLRREFRGGMRIGQALIELGLPAREVHHTKRVNTAPGKPRPSLQFFERHSEGELYDWLERARQKYLERCKNERPDLNNHHDQAVKLNALWERVKCLFARNGITLYS